MQLGAGVVEGLEYRVTVLADDHRAQTLGVQQGFACQRKLCLQMHSTLSVPLHPRKLCSYPGQKLKGVPCLAFQGPR